MLLSPSQIAQARIDMWDGDEAFNTPKRKPVEKVTKRSKPKKREVTIPRVVTIDRIKFLHLQGKTEEQIAVIVGGFSVEEIKGIIC